LPRRWKLSKRKQKLYKAVAELKKKGSKKSQKEDGEI
jgi:hypothetical protein